ncbi:hypothetical protein [Romboutsia sp. 1001285H_161024_C4]|nr:hypothetical protein [Romboutsia sp. 1001285H_161024_C4]
MYLLFREKNMMPMDYFKRTLGEKLIIRNFMEYELKENQEAYEEINSNF